MNKLNIQVKISRAEKYPAKQHAQRVARRLGATHGLIYLLGSYARNLEDTDMPRTWRQRRYFYYCSGVDVPNCCLVYDIHPDELVLYVPEFKPSQVIWYGRGPTLREAEERYDIDVARHNGHLFDDLRRWMRVNPDRTFFALHPDQRPQIEIANLDVDKLKPAMDLCRVIKDGYEIERIRRANDISAMAHRAVLENLSGFRNESQIQGVFENVCIANLAGQAYDPIAGSGENISVMHYSDNDSPLIGRQLVCLDAGAEFENYASDVTRTFPISGAWPSAEAESIYNLVKEMQEYCIQRLKPGVKLLLLHQAAHWIATRGLLELGIFHNGTVEEIYNAQTSLGFYLHGLSHHMGLDVHDTINVSLWDRCADDETPIETPRRSNVPPPCHSLEHPPLEEGMVITVEPGIYFSRYELHRAYLGSPKHARYINREVLERYWAVGGVRIEDDLLITASGYENLTTAPKIDEAMQLIRRGRQC